MNIEMCKKKKIHGHRGASFLYKHKLFLIAIIIIMDFFFLYQGNITTADETIVRKGNSFIKIKELNERSKATYGSLNHPYSFSEKELVDIFSHIFFQEKGILGYGKTEQVFTDADLAFILSPLLVEGFAQLKPTQYLLVYNSLTRSYLKNKHNYFCLFMVGQDLHITFSRIHQDLTRPYIDEENIIKNGIEFENPMDIKKGALWKLIPGSGQKLQPDRENTLIIPISSHPADSLITERDKKSSIKEVSQKRQDNKVDVSDLSEPNRISVNTGENDEAKQKNEVSNSLREQLRFLKNLFEEGLISNENYEKKKNDLLDKYFEVSPKGKQ